MGVLYESDDDDALSMLSQAADRPRKQPVVEVRADGDVQAVINRLAVSGGGTVVVTGAGSFNPDLTHANGVDLIVGPSDAELVKLRSLMGTR